MGGLEIWWTFICVSTVPLPVVCSSAQFLQRLVMGRIKKPFETKVGGFQIRGGGSRRWWSLDTCDHHGQTFVRFNAAEDWLPHVLVGKSRRTSPLPNLDIFDKIEEKVALVLGAATKDTSLGAMDVGLEDDAIVAAEKPRKPRACGTDVVISIVLQPGPRACGDDEESGDSADRKISILSRGKDRKRPRTSLRQPIWVAQDHICALLKHMAELIARDSDEGSTSAEAPSPIKGRAPTLEFVPASKAWILTFAGADGKPVKVTKYVKTHRRNYPLGRNSKVVREVLEIEVYNQHKRAVMHSVFDEAVHQGFLPTADWLERYGLPQRIP